MREVLFLDYGNTEDIHVNVIRRFSPDLKTIPILAASARFEGKEIQIKPSLLGFNKGK